MSKTSFMDTILNRPSQRYTEPVAAKPSRSARYQAPSDLPNAPNKPDSILAGNMFQANGSLTHGGGVYSQAPSVMSGKSNTSRFSLFGRKKKSRAPSISGGSIYHDGASSIAPTDLSASPRKGRWWEAGSLPRNKYSSRLPSVAGSVFSEPEIAGPPGFPRISDSIKASAPPCGARSDYGGPTSSSRIRYSSNPAPPPVSSLPNKSSMSSMRRHSGVAPLGQQAPNLMRQASTVSVARSNGMSESNLDLARPVSPAASMGRTRSTSSRVAAQGGSSDWNSFVKSMSGTDTAKVWETMPTLAPKPPRNTEKRSSVVANRIKKELEQDAQFQQVQRDPGLVQQDLLARAASQVIGEMPPTPISPLAEPQIAAVHLQPGQVVTPISPVYSPVASTSSINVAQYPSSMSLQASAVMSGAAAPAPILVPQSTAPVPMVHAPQQLQQQQVYPQQQYPQQFVHPQPVAYQYVDPAAAVASQQQVVPQQVVLAAPGLPPPVVPSSPPAQTYAPVAVAAPRVAAQPPSPAQHVAPSAPAATQPVPRSISPPAVASPAAAVAPPTTAQYLADRIEEQESADENAVSEEEEEEETTPEDSEESEISSDEGLVNGGHPTLDIVAEEDEEASSVGHNYHHEMRSHKSIKGKGPSRKYGEYEARLHSRQASAQSQQDASVDEVAPIAPSGVQIHVTEPSAVQQELPAAVVVSASAKQGAVSQGMTDVANTAQVSTTSSEVPVSQSQTVAPTAEPSLEQAKAAPAQATTLDRPQLVSRASEVSDYQSATSGRSTPTAKDEADGEDEEASAVAALVQARIRTKLSKESMSADAASIAPSQRQSIRTSRSSRPATAQRRISDISLGTSFAVSGILGRSGSSTRQNGDADSGSDAELSDDNAELRAKSLAEQNRLRKMNVGEDFFGPSISNMLDNFDRYGYSDATINKSSRDSEQPTRAIPPAAPVAAPVTTANQDINAEAQQVINEVRQKRAEVAAANGINDSKRNSADTGLAPSFAAVWLLNQAQGADSPPAGRQTLEEAGDETITASTLPNAAPNGALLSPNGASTERPKESVLNRPGPKSKRPNEMGGLAISEGKIEAESPQPQSPVEDTRSTLPMSLSQNSLPSAASSAGVSPSKQATKPVASKDKPAPSKSALKPKASRSLADTLFGIQFRSPSKEKKEKKEKKDKSKHKRKMSSDSIGSASNKSDRSSIIETAKRPASSSSSSISAPVAAEVSAPASPSAKALGKQRATDDASSSPVIAPEQAVAPAAMVPSETVNQFTTPSQSMANFQAAAGAETSPEKFHTAHDLKALADTAIPVYPTELAAAAKAQNVNAAAPADARPEHQRTLSEQMKSMDGFGSFALPKLESPQVAAPVAKVDEQEDVAPVQGAEPLEAVQAAPEAEPQAKPEAAVGASSSSSLPAPMQEDVADDALSVEHSSIPTSSEASVASTALTSPEAEMATKQPETEKTVVTESAASELAPAIPSAPEHSEKRLPMPPPPATDEVMAVSQDDRTPMAKPQMVRGVGINLIPPTPPALETRNSFTSSQAPGTPTIAEHDDGAAPQRPTLMSRSSSQRTATRSDSKANASTDSLSRSKSMAPGKKGIWKEYKGKGLSLPPGLVATTIDFSQLRRMSAQEKKTQSAPAPAPAPAPVAAPAAVAGPAPAPAPVQAFQVTPVVGQVVPLAPGSVLASPPRPVHNTQSPSPNSKRRSASPGPIPHSASMSRIMADAPPVPQIPAPYQGAVSVSSSSSRLYAYSAASSDHGWNSRSVSPAPSAVPSQSGRSVGSHVSSSVHSASYRSSPRPEYTYVNHHELSPYAKKMRALSPSPAVPTLAQTGNRHSLMSAINEWESQVPGENEEVVGLSPYPSRPVSPSPYPPLPTSTLSRGSSVINAVSSPAVVRNAPLGASTNQYLHPPIARSRMSADELAPVSESAIESLSPPSVIGAPSVVGRGSGASSVSGGSSPSASQSALSLSSTIPTSMPTMPTSYRPNKDPKRFSSNVDDLLNSRTTMQTVAVTSGAFASKNRSVVKRKKSVDLNGDRKNSSDLPEHLQDELSLTTLSITAHTPPPRKIGSHQVLVQVIAVAIDETDKLLLREKVRSDNAFGFVPGRSFCGRIVECGYEVKKMRKGDVVFGLQDSRKSGALAEFMVVDHLRICHAPSDCLTTEQIAALPSAGVMAHQLVQNHCSQLERGARVLILNAHDGVGLLAMQESVGLGLVIVAQCPPSVSDGVAVCQANGAHEVVIGEPLWAINSLHESSFDLIVDTVGGRKVYDASRRILASDGQFCTCFGDEHGTANPNLKSHFRSLRRAFFKKDKKNIGYEWVGVDTGEDCKEALEAVKRAAEQGDICPRLRSVLPFADAPRAFDPTTRNVNDEPGAIVVRVS
ncbi:hypothetical protein NDA16_000764 [Ustilago loliicola]|nr:hypothetical protein NDA16_000764 [Ustilago loliicola]